MNIETLTQLISNVGFPIVACCYLAYNNEKQNKVLDGFLESLKSIDIRLQNLEK